MKIDVDWSALSSHAINLVPKFAVIQMYLSPSISHTATESDTNDLKTQNWIKPQIYKLKWLSISYFPREFHHWVTKLEAAVQMFFLIGALKNFAIFTGKHLCWSLFLIKLRPAILLKRDFNTGVFRPILQNV